MNHVHVYILPYSDTYILILTFSVLGYVNEPGVIAYVNVLLTCVQYVYFIG